MMRRHRGHWLADSISDLEGWTVLSHVPWKPGVDRYQIVRHLDSRGEHRIVYVKNPDTLASSNPSTDEEELDEIRQTIDDVKTILRLYGYAFTAACLVIAVLILRVTGLL